MLQIDTRYGTDSNFTYSNGNTLPYTGTPFGMNYFVPQTTDSNGAWFFQPRVPIFQGIRLTHQPSPWIGDWAWLLLTPVTQLPSQPDLYHRQSSYDLDQAVFEPHYLRLKSLRYGITSQLAASRYGACLHFSQEWDQAIQLLLHSGLEHSFEQVDDYTLLGQVRQETETLQQKLTMYVCLRFDQPIKQVQAFDQDCCLSFDSSKLTCSLATSFLSRQQAQANLPALDLERTLEAAEAEWRTYLDRLHIIDSGKQDRRMFDHACYRIFLFPQTFYEVDQKGKEWHRDLTSGQICPGKLFTNNGFWDTFRSNFPLHSLILADRYPDFLEGFLNSYRETGYLPKWLAPDERGMMPGTLIDGVIADACVKDLAPELMNDFLAAMLTTARQPDPQGIYGRQSSKLYLELGYLPSDCKESISHSLDYAYSDFCIATVAQKLGEESLAKSFFQSALSYRQLYDPETGYMRAKDRSGYFVQPFSPYQWGGATAECSPIQASLGALHDLDGLKELMGGEKAFTQRLVQVFNDQAHYEVTGYGYEIHEMSEMATAQLGQFAISNQPSFHLPYLFQESCQPDYTSYLISTLRRQTFKPGLSAYPGDEDNGSLSAWYLFSCLGFFPICPGKPDYALGIPLFPHIKIYLPASQKWLHIKSQEAYPHHHFVKQVRLDGQVVTKLSHQELLQADLLEFETSWLPGEP